MRLRHRAVVRELRAIRGLVHRWAVENALPEGTEIDLQLALGEAVSNGMEHAYRDTEAGMVEIDLEIRSSDHLGGGNADAVAVLVADQGTWRPPPPQPGYRGRGLALITTLAGDMRVARTRFGTQVSFEIPIR